MNPADPLMHFLGLAAIMLVMAFMTVITTGMALYKGSYEYEVEEAEDPEYEPGELDLTPYPDDEDSVIFRK